MSDQPETASNLEAGLAGLAREDYCYLTTTGRVSGRLHEIEIWFGVEGQTLYLLSGGGDHSDWVRNIDKAPAVRVRIRKLTFEGRARRISNPEEELTARRLLAGKYQAWREGRKMTEWARTALPIAIEIQAALA